MCEQLNHIHQDTKSAWLIFVLHFQRSGKESIKRSNIAGDVEPMLNWHIQGGAHHRISRYRMRAWGRISGPDFALINPLETLI